MKGYAQVVNVTNIRSALTMQVDHLQGRDAKKRKTEQLNLGKGKVIEVKLVKHDEALQELKEV